MTWLKVLQDLYQDYSREDYAHPNLIKAIEDKAEDEIRQNPEDFVELFLDALAEDRGDLIQYIEDIIGSIERIGGDYPPLYPRPSKTEGVVEKAIDRLLDERFV